MLVKTGRASNNQKEWSDKNPERIKKIAKKSYIKNIDYRLANARKHKYKRRNILSKDVEFGIDEQKIVLRRDGSKCAYCHIIIEEITFDHIIPIMGKKGINGSNSVNNIVVCCRECNMKKTNFSLDEWFERKYCVDKNINKETINKIVYKLLKKRG